MKIIQEIKLDLSKAGVPPQIIAKQGDCNTRRILIHLLSDGAPWSPPANTSVVVGYRKSDGTSGLYDTLPDGTAACAVSGSTVTVTLAPQVLSAAGLVLGELTFRQGDKLLGTSHFAVLVQAVLNEGTALDSQNYYKAITLEEINNALDDRLPLSGGTMAGAINMDGSRITGVGAPTDDADVATKEYVDRFAGSGSGAAPMVTVETIEGGSRITFTDTSGSQSVNVMDGKDADGFVPDYVRVEADRVAQIVRSQQNADTLTFIAISDMHNDSESAQTMESLRHAGQAIDLICQQVNVDFCTVLGDSTQGDAATTLDAGRQELAQVNQFLSNGFRGVPNFRTPGNHDHLTHSYSVNGDHLHNSEIYALMGKFNTGATLPDADRDRGYCYRDFPDVKIRVICLNTADMRDAAVSGNCDGEYMSGQQLKWLAQTLDMSDKANASDWGIIFLSHHPLDWGALVLAANLVGGYLSGGTVSMTKDGIAIDYDYSGKNRAAIIGAFHGHIHNYRADHLNTVSDGIPTPTDVWQLAIPNACFSRNNEYGQNGTAEFFGIEYGEAVTYQKQAGTAQDTAFCVITVDTAAQKIYAVHYGAGYDRTVSYSKNGSSEEPDVSYTNLVSEAQEYASTAVYNGTGYQDGTYISSSGAPYEGIDAACVATGFMPYTMPAAGVPLPLYIKGATLDTSAGHVRLYFFREDKSIIALFIQGGTEENKAFTTYFTMEKLGDQYYKLTPIPAGGNCQMLQVAAELANTAFMRFSLIGTGENLVITVDEPIE